jgi:hypothetical protein
MITKDGYAAVPWGTRYVILYNGEQISDVATAAEAVAYIRNAQNASNPKTPAKTPRKSRKKSVGRLTLDA